MKKKNLLAPLFGVAALVGLAYVGLRYFSTEAAPSPAPAQRGAETPGIIHFGTGSPQLSMLQIGTVTRTPLPVAEPTNARITYDENVTVRVSSPIAGRILALRKEIGDRVTRGTVLADIDAPDLAAAEADWHKAEADEARKKLALDRAKLLLDAEVLARKDYEAAEADFKQAHAETRRAQLRMKNLHTAGNSDGRFGLVAPIAGVVSDRQANPGQEIRPDLPNPLFVVTDPGRLWAMIDAPETLAAKLHVGQAVRLESDAYPNEAFPATVDRIGLALDPVTRRIQVRCMVLNPTQRLKPEMFVSAAFLADGDKTAIRVPNTALFVEGLYDYVFLTRKTGQFEKRRVHVVARGRAVSYVDEGLNDGDALVVQGALLLNAEAAGNAQ